MIRTLVVLLCLGGCHSSNHPEQVADAAVADAAVDGAIVVDAPSPGCPVRTAPPGQPEGTVPLDAVHNGDYKISSSLDVEALAGILVITGDLTVEPTATELALPDLEVIGGNFNVYDFNAILPSLPNLQTVGGAVSITAEGAMAFDIGQLDSTGSDFMVDVGATAWSARCLRLDGNELGIFGPTLTVDLPKLTDAKLLQLTGSTELTSLSLPAMTTVGDVNIACPALTTIAFDQLETASSISISGPPLTSVTFPSLTSVNGALGITNTSIANLDSLTHVATVGTTIGVASNPQLTELSGLDHVTSAGAIDIDNNASLITLGFANLTTLTGTMLGSSIENNAMLPTCQATALQTRVGASITISGNDDAGTCP